MNQAIADKALAGQRLSADELRELLKADILELGMLADEVRRKLARATVSYARVHSLTPAELASGAEVPLAASALRISGLPGSMGEAVEAVRRARVLAGARPVRAFSFGDLAACAGGGWGALGDVLHALADAGLTDLDEIAADRIDDLPSALELVRRAGLRGERVTVSMPLDEGKIEAIERVRGAQDLAGGITRFAPLPRNPAVDVPTTGYDDLRTVALARVAFAHATTAGVPVSIEVDWQQYGPKLAQVALTFGADFLDGVSATSDDALGRRRGTVEDVERNIRAAGFDAAEVNRQAAV